jgi:hypothetical protein
MHIHPVQIGEFSINPERHPWLGRDFSLAKNHKRFDQGTHTSRLSRLDQAL